MVFMCVNMVLVFNSLFRLPSLINLILEFMKFFNPNFVFCSLDYFCNFVMFHKNKEKQIS